MWSGVPVRYVAEALGGVAPGMRYITGTGGEKLPDGVDPLSVMVERSVPIKAHERRAAGLGDERRADRRSRTAGRCA